jgi:hypothetical protein
VSELLSRDCDEIVRPETMLRHDPRNGLLSEVALNLNIHFAKVLFKANALSHRFGKLR